MKMMSMHISYCLKRPGLKTQSATYDEPANGEINGDSLETSNQVTKA